MNTCGSGIVTNFSSRGVQTPTSEIGQQRSSDIKLTSMTRVQHLIVFAFGILLLGIAWIFGIFVILGAHHVYNVSPAQASWLARLQWWSMVAPAFVLVVALVLVLYEDLGPQRPGRLFWYNLLPMLGACAVSVITWSGAWFFTLDS